MDFDLNNDIKLNLQRYTDNKIKKEEEGNPELF
jgi:hypothetical protein